LTKARSQSRKARLFTSIIDHHVVIVGTIRLLSLGSLDRGLGEEAAEERVEEGVEDNLGTTRCC